MKDPLTVSSLIEILQKFPSDLPVVLDGYEWGVGRITSSSVKKCTVQEADKKEFSAVYIERNFYQPDRDSYGAKLEIIEESILEGEK